MKCVMMIASNYGMQCFEAVYKIPCVCIIGVITTKEFYELRYDGGKKIKHMQNQIYHVISERCKELEVPLYSIIKMNEECTIQKLKEWNPELIIVSGWYHLIGKKILGIPKMGVIGLHPSLLPKYRGGAPLVWQMINAEKYAGITLFYMDSGVDSGDIIGQESVEIEYGDTIGSLYDKVGKKGIELLEKYIPQIKKCCAPRVKQKELRTEDIWMQRTPEDGHINWDCTSRQLYDFIRAQTNPYPGAFTVYEGKEYTIWKSEIVPCKMHHYEPGTIIKFESVDGFCSCIVASKDRTTAIKLVDFQIRDNLLKTENLLMFENGKKFY
ncbi:MAG: methionyl-tRNA formyltransferase [Lachnospiraceae bacterium]|nr:methionyl-tRNA formyltransferase [Lachnospiraceae bacterium]